MEKVINRELFTSEIKSQLKEAVLNLDRNQLLWLEGFVNGVLDATNVSKALVKSEVQEVANVSTQNKRLKVLYGSHSGNSIRIANLLKNEAENNGISCEVVDMADYNARKIKDEEQLIVVVSTHGEGEPPDSAEEFYHFLSSKKAPKLGGIPFSVVALGDSAYSKFCQTGVDFYQFLEKLGGKPVGDVIKFDTDFQEHLESIIPDLVQNFITTESGGKSQETKTKSQQFVDTIVEAPVYEKIQLNGRGSQKETWHIEIGTDESELKYEPGDALEVYANNDSLLVSEIIKELNLSELELVIVNKNQISLAEALQYHFELTIVTPQVLKKYATFLDDGTINKLLDDVDQLDAYLEGTDVLDLLKQFPVKLSASDLLSVLRKLPPRLYSISSSQEAVGDEVHITVSAVRYEKNNRSRGGVCSTYLADRVDDVDNLKVKVRPNFQFRLPENNDTNIVMIGAGTGIAPFRSFLQHRDAIKAKGKNWLVFGDQRFASDFLYQAEWLKYRQRGVLTRMDVAFSRDQKEKIYVQNRLKENSKALFSWIENGAHIYLCGDMKKMAKDVKKTLLEIISFEGKLSEKEASDLLKNMKKEKRYQEDVY